MKNGYTLIELLAVIVIVAIISVITVPMIMSSIETSNQKTTLESAKELIRIASTDVVDKKYELPHQYKVEEKKLDYQKGGFIRGLIVVTSGNHSFVENLSTEKYCINGPLDDLKITPGKCSVASYKDYQGSTSIQKKYILQSEGSSEDGLYFDDFTKTYYFKGNVTDNYVSYAGYTWRIVSFSNGTVRLISQGVLNDIPSKNYTSMLDFLEGTFYTNLSQKEYILETSYSTGLVTDVTNSENIIASEETEHTKYKIGLLTAGEYKRATGNSGNFLTNGTTWLLTKRNNTYGYYLSSSTISSTSLTSSYTVRPVIVLNEAVVYSGLGTSTNPYVVQ